MGTHMDYYERLYDAVSRHLWGRHQEEGTSFLSMSQELGLAKETVRKIARRDYKPGCGPNVQSLIAIQSYYSIHAVGMAGELPEDLLQDLIFLAKYLPFFSEGERELMKTEVLRQYEKKKLQDEIPGSQQEEKRFLLPP